MKVLKKRILLGGLVSALPLGLLMGAVPVAVLPSLYAVEEFDARHMDFDAILRQSDISKLESALKAGLDPDYRDSKGAPLLFTATLHKNIPALRALLKYGAYVDVQYKAYMDATPLMLAVQMRSLDAAKALIESSVNLNTRDINGDSAINWAAFYGYVNFIDLLLKAGASTQVSGQGSAIEIAMRRGHQDVVKRISRYNKVPAPSSLGQRLMAAIDANDAVAVNAVLNAGAYVNGLDETGRPLLARAARLGNLSALKVMVKDGCAFVDKKDPIGFTSLMEAAREGQLDVVEFLLKNKASALALSYPAGLSMSPMHVAAVGGNIDIITRLKDAGAAIDVKDRDGTTALIWSLGEGKVNAAIALIRLGADPYHKSKYGISAEELALQIKSAELDAAILAVKKK